jgi:hypothetical protein
MKKAIDPLSGKGVLPVFAATSARSIWATNSSGFALLSRGQGVAPIRGAAEPTARVRPVDIDLTWATRNEKCRKL